MEPTGIIFIGKKAESAPEKNIHEKTQCDMISQLSSLPACEITEITAYETSSSCQSFNLPTEKAKLRQALNECPYKCFMLRMRLGTQDIIVILIENHLFATSLNEEITAETKMLLAQAVE